MKAYVICCNDCVQYVILNSEAAAITKKNELKAQYFKKMKWQFDSYEEYDNRYFWHLHEVSYS